MEIRHITDQKQPLEEFYSQMILRNPDGSAAKRMLELIRHLATINGPLIWGLTSHLTLNLVSGDDWRLPTLVNISCPFEDFRIQYRIPPQEAPWPDAYVIGATNDLVRAGEMVVIGLNKALEDYMTA